MKGGGDPCSPANESCEAIIIIGNTYIFSPGIILSHSAHLHRALPPCICRVSMLAAIADVVVGDGRRIALLSCGGGGGTPLPAGWVSSWVLQRRVGRPRVRCRSACVLAPASNIGSELDVAMPRCLRR